MSENKKIPTMAIVVSTVALVVGFGSGIFYQKSKTPSFAGFNNQANRTGQMQGVRGAQQGNNNRATGFSRPILGQIVSSDDKSITVKLQDGSSKIVILSDSTNINKAATATKADLITGQTISAFGQANPDGSVTAQNIQLNPVDFKTNSIITPGK